MKGPRILKAAAALAVLGYCSLLVYQGGTALTFQENARVQVPDLTIETVTKTAIDESVLYKNITLDDIFISVKTSKKFQYSRLPYILKTWYQLAKQQTWFFTDTDDEHTDLESEITDGHLVNTNCSASHGRESLCCKMSVEYDHYIESSKKWFCHFDDDNYVNVPRLVTILQRYNHQEEWYLGKNSINKPLKITIRENQKKNKKSEYRYMFATGGAGFCISRSLAFKMVPVASGGRFISICNNIRLPDDVTLGFIIEVLMKKKLTVLPEFHSHLELLRILPAETFKDQISFSYDIWWKNKNTIGNILDVPGINFKSDPTRFLSLHCFLFPHTEFCPR